MESSGKSLSVAFYNGKDLFISLNALQLYFLNTKGNYISNFTGIEYAMYSNSILSLVILHESEHIAQYKMTLNPNNTIETPLLSPSFSKTKSKEELKILEELTKKFYMFKPAERLAQINSYKTLLNALSLRKNEIERLYELEKNLLISETLNAYPEAKKLGGCPSFVYLNGIERKDIWESLPFYDEEKERLLENVTKEYSLEKRLTLGLPITSKEYKNLY